MDLSIIFSPLGITIITLIITALFFMFGTVRSDIVALCSMLTLLLTGVLNTQEALSGFSSSVVIMMVGLFIVGAGIFRTGLAKMIGSKILQWGGNSETKLFLLVIVVTAVIGGFVSNTGTVAVMMPIVISMAASAGISTRRFLMPMAFASGMGMFTLISTPPNLVIQEELTRAGYEPLQFFSFAPVGLVAVVTGVGLLFFLSKRLSRKKDERKDEVKRGKSLSELVEEYNISKNVYKISVPERSSITGKSLGEMHIATTYLVGISKIMKKNSDLKLPWNQMLTEIAEAKSIVNKGDILYCHGSEENVARFVSDFSLQVESLTKKEAARIFSDLGIAEVFIMPNAKIINKTVRESRFQEKHHLNVLGIKRQGDYKIGETKEAKLHSGDALLIQGTWNDIATLANQQGDLIVVGQPEKQAAQVTLDHNAPIAATIMLAMIVVMILNIIPAVAVVLTAAVLMVLTGCLRNMEEAYNSVSWSSVVLIASMIPMAIAFEKTGITAIISNWLTSSLSGVSPIWLLAVIYFATSLFTMFMSNTATAILFTPIAMKVAISMGVSPYPLLFAVAVAATMCFASPFSTPPNAMVMSAGRYTVIDYVKTGLPLQLIMGVIMVLVLPLLFPF